MKVYITPVQKPYTEMFMTFNWEIALDIEDADLVCFIGGPDVGAHLYNNDRHPLAVSVRSRDDRDIKIFKMAQEMGIPCVGICRGGQLLNVLSGGTLYQHVDGHQMPHDTMIMGGRIINVSSTHHQMMIPNRRIDYSVLASNTQIGTFKEHHLHSTPPALMNHIKDDVECIYYPHNNCLCFQPHPEHEGFKDCTKIFFFFINNYLFDKDDKMPVWPSKYD